MKAALVNTDIFYCYIDDFYSGNADELKFGALIKEMYRYIDSAVHLNVNEMFSAALKATRIEMSDAEKNNSWRSIYEPCRCPLRRMAKSL